MGCLIDELHEENIGEVLRLLLEALVRLDDECGDDRREQTSLFKLDPKTEGYEDWTHKYEEGINVLFIVYYPVLIVFTNQIVHSGPSGTLGLDSNTLNLIIRVVGSILKGQR